MELRCEPRQLYLRVHGLTPIPPLLWVLGGGSGLGREYKDALREFTV